MSKPILLRSKDAGTMSADWGELTWFASAALGNSNSMTVGRCVLKPGCANPPHFHPNCEETLVVVEGCVAHTIDEGKTVDLAAGDTITIPSGFTHQAQNTGTTQAVIFIAFSSADRQTKGE